MGSDKKSNIISLIIALVGLLLVVFTGIFIWVTVFERQEREEVVSEVSQYSENLDNVRGWSAEEMRDITSVVGTPEENRARDFPELVNYDGGKLDDNFTIHVGNGFYLVTEYKSELNQGDFYTAFFSSFEEREKRTGIKSSASFVYINRSGEIVELNDNTFESMLRVWEADKN